MHWATVASLLLGASGLAPLQPQSSAQKPPLSMLQVAVNESDEQPGPALTLQQALDTARARQPRLRQAHAITQAAQARADIARAPLLPQLSGTGSYQRTTANFVLRPGALPSQAFLATSKSTLKFFNFYNFGLSLNQLIYDFGQTTGRWDAAKANAVAQEENERGAQLQVDLNVRTTYFNARAAKALLGVAKETLSNQDRHLRQIRGFVEVGTRPAIDLAQARTDVANARVQLINADNNYETSKAQLNQAMGVEDTIHYDVVDEVLPPVEGEDLPLENQLEEALRARPEYASLQSQIRAQELTLRSIQGAYGPSLGLTAGATEAGSALEHFGWNLNAGLSLTWNIFQGGLTWAQTREARANVTSLQAQADAFRQQVRLEVEQARLAVRAAKEGLVAAEEAAANAKERLKLAEGRYQTGVGNVIELGDAQLAVTSADGQKVQAAYNLSAARAQLLKALGRP